MKSFLLLASGFGLGWLPWAPGTFGSLLGLPLLWWLSKRSFLNQIKIMVPLLFIAVALCHWSSEQLGGGDPSQIVADEFVALPIVVLGLAVGRQPGVMAIAFILFRLFDISKPPPISHIEAIGGGLGIVLDDVMAAIYAWMLLGSGVVLWRRYHLKKKL